MNQVKRTISSTTVRNATIASVSNGQPQLITFGLPNGWKREECIRPNGLGTGKTEVFYISPTGQKIRTKQEMKSILGESFDMANFDWRSGKFVAAVNRPRVSDEDASLPKVARTDNCATGFVRRSSPPDMFQPVIIRSHPECKRTDVRYPQHDAPHQLFWEKRLANCFAVDPETGEAFKPMTLPQGLQSAGVPGYQSAQLVQSLVNALSSKTSPITGQEQQSSSIEKNPCVAVNPLQPMIKTYIVSDDDIRRQESRVRELRKRLENARKKLNPRYSSERHG